MASSNQSFKSQSCNMGGDRVGLFDRRVGIPEMQLIIHKTGLMDQWLHVAPDRGREGRRRRPWSIPTLPPYMVVLYGGPRGWAFSYERGTPVWFAQGTHLVSIILEATDLLP